MMDALAPWHIILLVVVILVLFGAKRLPGAAQALGRSMHIFKNSVQGNDVDLNGVQQPSPQASQVNLVPPALTPAAPPPAAPAQDRDDQLTALQRQIEELQRQGHASPAASATGGTSQPQAQPQSSQQSF